MPSIDTGLITQTAKSRLLAMTLPAGTDRNRLLEFIGPMCSAIGNGLRTWQSQTRLTGVTVMALTATGGRLVGPPLEPFILAQVPRGWEPYGRPIAAGLHNQIRSFCDEVRVPGMPWYPAFAAFPGPMAPPMPNVPSPLMALSGSAVRHMKEDAIASAIIGKVGNPKPPCCNEVAKAIAAGVDKAFQLWVASTIVTMVMGRGPVPTFAPPVCPVGPVVGGSAEGQPGHLA